MDFVDELDGVEIIDARVQADLVHDGNAGFFDLFFEGEHCGRDVARRDDVGLGADCGFDDGGMVDVGDEGDDDVGFGELLVQCFFVRHVEADGVCVLDAGAELFGGFEGSAR